MKMSDDWVAHAAARVMDEFPDDYVGLWQISKHARLQFGETALAREKTFEVVRLVLSKGVIAVDLMTNGGFTPWPETDPDTLIARLRREWAELEFWPRPCDLCWFWLPLPGDPR